ncbi:MAG: Bax inhibitor-1/YccA family protein [Fimbriimonadaceae bacterium]|nr:Bax inhibitor-1/YccA family protein [Fimbriimonadaceae bacterium]
MSFRTSNPTLNEETFDKFGPIEGVNATPMTLSGMISKTVILLAILVAFAFLGWQTPSYAFLVAGVVATLAVGITLAFKPQWSAFLAPVYSIFMGLAMGTLSKVVTVQLADTKYANAVPLAVLGTMATLGIMLGLYASRIIKVTQTFIMVVAGATLAIMATYLLTWIIPGMSEMVIFKSGAIGIGFSVFVIILAALNFALDFHLVETGIKRGAPKYMEWYCGFAILVTMVWLYWEFLKLFMKLAGRR